MKANMQDANERLSLAIDHAIAMRGPLTIPECMSLAFAIDPALRVLSGHDDNGFYSEVLFTDGTTTVFYEELGQ